VSTIKASHDDANVIAALDLGSNSIKMTVARRGPDGEVDDFLWRSETVRLGQGIEASGALATDRIEAALDTLTRFAAEARAAGASRLIGVATEATRVASNGPAFVNRVGDELGIEIKTISGDQEAKLTFLGLRGAVDLDGRIAIADIGGASTEIILAHDKRIAWSRSFALGSGRLTDRLVAHDPPAAQELAACRAHASETVAEAPFAQVAGGRLIVVGGTGEYLDRLVPAGVDHDGAALEEVLGRMSAIDSHDLAAQLSIALARARVLPAGIAIARGIADLMEPASFVAAQSGIRNGLLMAAFAGEL
jgi:exopolyphosphatase/guanosine-5'-triphosphate,3'-diphosphate pyrophosphatase